MKKLLIPGIFVLITIAAVMLTNTDADSSYNSNDIWQPEPGLTWQIQFVDALDTSVDADVYFIDLFDTTVETISSLQQDGRRVVCYISAGTYEDWRPDTNAFPDSVVGNPLGDWPGEQWLDISKLKILGPIMENRIGLAAEKGCDAVDTDNVDSYTQDTGFSITPKEQIVYNKFLAKTAHGRDLAIGLKNDVDQIDELVDSFDFAVNEECFYYNECEKLDPFIGNGKAVFNIEYELETTEFCPQANSQGFSSIKKNLELDAWRKSC